MSTFRAETFTLFARTPAVRVLEEGNPLPWEFVLRHTPRTPLQRCACEARAVQYVAHERCAA